MDSLKTLMDKKQYDLVLKLTENSTDSNAIFYRASAFLAIGKAEDSLKTIKDNREILKQNIGLLLKVHIEVLCILEKFDEAYEEMEYYENLPYESQQVEEALKYYRNFIREAEKASLCSKNLSEEDIIARLTSDKPSAVLDGLQAIRSLDVLQFLPFVEKIMVENKVQAIRSFALMLLVEKKINRTFDFLHLNEIIQINPSLQQPPFVGKEFLDFINLIQTDFKNPTLAQNGCNVYSTYLIFIYPDVCKIEENVLLCAIYGIANELLSNTAELSLEQKCYQKAVDVQEVRKVMEILKNSIEVI